MQHAAIQPSRALLLARAFSGALLFARFLSRTHFPALSSSARARRETSVEVPPMSKPTTGAPPSSYAVRA
eukprot:3976477-Pleurochrysis_carterae.AAC.3